MKDSRVVDFVNTVSPLHSVCHCNRVVWYIYSTYLRLSWHQVCTLQYRKLDFEEFAASAISVYQMEALETWEQHARRAYELFDKEGNRPIVIEELASVWFHLSSLLCVHAWGLLITEHCSSDIFFLPGTWPWPISATSRRPPGLDQTRWREAELPGVHKTSAWGFIALNPKSLVYTIPASINQGDDRWLSQSLAGVCVRVRVFCWRCGWRIWPEAGTTRAEMLDSLVYEVDKADAGA